MGSLIRSAKRVWRREALRFLAFENSIKKSFLRRPGPSRFFNRRDKQQTGANLCFAFQKGESFAVDKKSFHKIKHKKIPGVHKKEKEGKFLDRNKK